MTKNTIYIKQGEKELYNVFKKLERYGHTTFSFPDRKTHVGLARSIGIRGKPLIKDGLLIPPLSSTNKHRMTGVQIPHNVVVKEKKTNNGWWFSFKRKK